MSIPRPYVYAFGFTFSVIAAVAPSYSQVAQPTPNAAQPALNPKAAVPVAMTECEGTNNCANWTFLGSQGNGQWPTGEVANLSVEGYDINTVTIRRADSTGSSAGLTAVYTGTRHDDHVVGEFTSSWPGHWEKKTGAWYATVGSPITPPSVMHFCDVNCVTLKWEDGHYLATNDNEIWTVESFTRESVILRRTVTRPAFTKIYKGQISPEGDRLVNAVNPFAGPGQPAKIDLAWGAALGSVPGSNAERDRAQGSPQPRQPVLVVAPVVCIPWFFTMVCAN
jgi:hypothetical protein